MKKKFLSFIFAICLIVPCAFWMIACGETPPPEDDEPTLTNVEVIISDEIAHYYNSDTKTFTISNENYVYFDNFYFTVLGTYSDDTTQNIYENVSVSIPSELTGSPIPVSSTPYEIVISYETYTFTYYVNVLPSQVAIPVPTTKTYEYDSGNTLTFEWDSIDYSNIEILGLEQSNPGTHTVTVSLYDGFVWEDGTSDPKTFEWVIEKGKIETPTYTDNYTIRYHKYFEEFAPNIYSFEIDNYMLDLDVEPQTNVGDYTATLVISDEYSDYYEWADGAEDITLNWSIEKGLLTKPTCPGGNPIYEYNPYNTDFVVELGFNDFDSELMTATGDSASVVGEYSATISITDKNKYMWEDETDSDLTFDWKIIRYTISGVPALAEWFNYNGSAQTPFMTDISDYDDELYTILESDGSTISAINAGQYEVILALKDKDNCQWYDGSYENKSFAWEIRPLGIAYHFSEESYPYKYGETITAYSDLSTDLFNVSGENTGMTAGKYTALITLKDTTNYRWTDYMDVEAPSSDQPYRASWKILPLNINFDLVDSELTYNGQEQSISFDWDKTDLYKVLEGDTTGKDVSNYTVKVELLDKTNFRWRKETSSHTGGIYTTEDLTFIWKINTKYISNEEYDTFSTYQVVTTYNGQEQEITIPAWFDADNMEIYDVANDKNVEKMTGTNAGRYRYTIVSKVNSNGKYNYLFENYGYGNNEYIQYFYQYLDINKVVLVKPTDKEVNFIYDGNLKTYTPNGYEDIKDFVTLTGNKETSANTYTSVISLNDTANYIWEDETDDNLEFEWIIKKMQIVLPTEGTKEFNFEEETLREYVPTFDTEHVTIGGVVTGTDAGDYTVTFTLKDTANTEWVDETIEVKSHTWTILRKAAIIAYSPDGWQNLIADNIYETLMTEPCCPMLKESFTSEYPKIQFEYAYTQDGGPTGWILGEGVYTITLKASVHVWENNYRLPTNIEEIQRYINPDYVESTAEFIANGCQITITRNIYESEEYQTSTEYFSIEPGHIYEYDGEEHAPTYDLEANLDQIALQYHINREDISMEETYHVYNGEQLEDKPTEVGHYYMQIVIKIPKLEVAGYTIPTTKSKVYLYYYICDHEDKYSCGICTNCGTYEGDVIELSSEETGYYTTTLIGSYSAGQTYYVKVTNAGAMSYIISDSNLSEYKIFKHYHDEANNQLEEITCSQGQFTGPYEQTEFYIVFTPNIDITEGVVFTISQPV